MIGIFFETILINTFIVITPLYIFVSVLCILEWFTLRTTYMEKMFTLLQMYIYLNVDRKRAASSGVTLANKSSSNFKVTFFRKVDL